MLYVLALSSLFVLSHAEPRIVGGQPADYSDYPYIVSFYGDGYLHSCGGSLITDPSDDNPIVLTAAHCTDGINLNYEDYYVDIGREIVTSDQGQTYDTIKVIAISQHPNYNDSTTEADVALLQLERAVDSSINAEMVTWDVDTTLDSNDWLTVIGYGNDESGGYYTSTLEYVNKTYMNNTICDAYFYLYFYENVTDWSNPDLSLAAGQTTGIIYDDMMCAHAVNKDSCQGDSGGPLIIPGVSNDYTDDIQVGIVSWGYGCASGTPGVYASVPYYRTWISNCIDYLGGDDEYKAECDNTTETTTTTSEPLPDSTCQTINLCNTYSPGLYISHTSNVSSTLNVGLSQEFVTMEISINGTHTYMGDFVIRLTAPTGDSLILLNRTGGGSNGFYMIFSDSGSRIHDNINFLSGNSYRPQEGTFYSRFGGIDSDGDWTLSITDVYSGDIGYLSEFCITEVCFPDDDSDDSDDDDDTTTPAPTPGTSCETITDVCNDYAASPLVLDDTNSVTSNLDVDLSGQFVTMEISIYGNHTWMGDLLMQITAPTGDELIIFNRTGGSSNGFNMVFSDSGSTLRDNADFYAGNSYRPQLGTFYSAFGGIDVEGTWTLDIVDYAEGDAGYLTEFCITEVCRSNNSGAYTIKYGISIVLMVFINIMFIINM